MCLIHSVISVQDWSRLSSLVTRVRQVIWSLQLPEGRSLSEWSAKLAYRFTHSCNSVKAPLVGPPRSGWLLCHVRTLACMKTLMDSIELVAQVAEALQKFGRNVYFLFYSDLQTNFLLCMQTLFVPTHVAVLAGNLNTISLQRLSC